MSSPTEVDIRADWQDEPDSVAMIVPTGDEAGPRTFLRVQFCGRKEVTMPLSASTARNMIREWSSIAEATGDPQNSTRDSIIEQFLRGNDLTDHGTTNIIAAVLYYIAKKSEPKVLDSMLDEGGYCFTAIINDQGNEQYRFRVEFGEI